MSSRCYSTEAHRVGRDSRINPFVGVTDTFCESRLAKFLVDFDPIWPRTELQQHSTTMSSRKRKEVPKGEEKEPAPKRAKKKRKQKLTLALKRQVTKVSYMQLQTSGVFVRSLASLCGIGRVEYSIRKARPSWMPSPGPSGRFPQVIARHDATFWRYD